MTRPMRLARRAASAVVLAVMALLTLQGVAHAEEAVPYVDPAASGALGLCSRDGTTVTSGNIHDKPFVWKAVTTAAAPAPYDEDGATATLFGYQPRVGVSPGMWSGMLLTASSRFSDPAYPTAQATARDFTLADFLGDFPAEWNGHVQLRLYLGGPGLTPRTTAYATSDIQVTGQTWHVVGGGVDVPCDKGKAVSLETLLPAGNTAGLESSEASGDPTGSTSQSVQPETRGSTSPGSAGGSAGSPVARQGASGTSGTSAVRSLVLLAGGVVLGLAIALGVRRRRDPSPELDNTPAALVNSRGRHPSNDLEERAP